jgi:tRNA threonylcarbamoyladenosine biosynthesis protein TsaE
MTLILETRSTAETEALAQRLAQLLPRGAVVALRGELASGKTCFVRGMASHLAPGALVHSPTFTLVNEYGCEVKLFHLDLYRLSGLEEIADLGYEELFEPNGVCVIEWAERAERLLPARRVDVFLEHAGPGTRRIAFYNHNILPENWEEYLRKATK